MTLSEHVVNALVWVAAGLLLVALLGLAGAFWFILAVAAVGIVFAVFDWSEGDDA
jgi:hypothetical protein